MFTKKISNRYEADYTWSSNEGWIEIKVYYYDRWSGNKFGRPVIFMYGSDGFGVHIDGNKRDKKLIRVLVSAIKMAPQDWLIIYDMCNPDNTRFLDFLKRNVK